MSDSHVLKHRLTLLPGTRLDGALHLFLVERFPELSRNQVKRALENRWIRRSSLPKGEWAALSPSLKGDASPLELELEIDWRALEQEFLPRSLVPRVQGCALEILYEDDRLLVLNKPSGMPSAPLHYDEEDTAVHHALAHYPELPRTHPKEPGLLHRLDTGTSGCLAFAKTQEAYDSIKKAWKLGQIKKFYLARVSQLPPGRLPIEIELPLGHDPKSSRRMRVADKKIRGKPLPARTTVLEARPVGPHTELLIQLHTGVMHQIRVHLAALGCPIVGDRVYGGEEAGRLELHCLMLLFTNWTNGHPGVLTVEARVLNTH